MFDHAKYTETIYSEQHSSNQILLFVFGVKTFGIIETFSIAFLRGTANVKLQFRV